ncbi:hypothetical protein F511_17993 [Dorcoceras hygrometricum]|uniref:Uncharacterized protein n=1 Tax=Dorcoceras hygrometricum TaxID=472368 RepID=A0A2Z7C2Y1_9LAMI|nr:hypothetical protein F511_17993 [Dorcoceras hygrometricum]
MLHEYRQLSQTFEDVKAEKKCLKDKSDDLSCSQLDDSDSLKNELNVNVSQRHCSLRLVVVTVACVWITCCWQNVLRETDLGQTGGGS